MSKASKEAEAADKKVSELLQKTVLLDNGEEGYVFTLDNSLNMSRRYCCHVCTAFVGSAVCLFQHADGKCHKRKMLDLFHEHSKFTKIVPREDNLKCAEEKNLNAKETSAPVSKVDDMKLLEPGQPAPPGLEDECKPYLPQIKNRLEQLKSAAIGLEFLAEVVVDAGEPIYICVLCDKKGDSRIVLNHLISYNHRMAYIERYFPRVAQAFDKVPRRPELRRGTTECLAIIVHAIEKRFGRLKPYITDTSRSKEDLLEIMNNGPHFFEAVKDSPFHTMVDMSFIKNVPPEGKKTIIIDKEKEEVKILSMSEKHANKTKDAEKILDSTSSSIPETTAKMEKYSTVEPTKSFHQGSSVSGPRSDASKVEQMKNESAKTPTSHPPPRSSPLVRVSDHGSHNGSHNTKLTRLDEKSNVDMIKAATKMEKEPLVEPQKELDERKGGMFESEMKKVPQVEPQKELNERKGGMFDSAMKKVPQVEPQKELDERKGGVFGSVMKKVPQVEPQKESGERKGGVFGSVMKKVPQVEPQKELDERKGGVFASVMKKAFQVEPQKESGERKGGVFGSVMKKVPQVEPQKELDERKGGVFGSVMKKVPQVEPQKVLGERKGGVLESVMKNKTQVEPQKVSTIGSTTKKDSVNKPEDELGKFQNFTLHSQPPLSRSPAFRSDHMPRPDSARTAVPSCDKGEFLKGLEEVILGKVEKVNAGKVDLSTKNKTINRSPSPSKLALTRASRSNRRSRSKSPADKRSSRRSRTRSPVRKMRRSGSPSYSSRRPPLPSRHHSGIHSRFPKPYSRSYRRSSPSRSPRRSLRSRSPRRSSRSRSPRRSSRSRSPRRSSRSRSPRRSSPSRSPGRSSSSRSHRRSSRSKSPNKSPSSSIPPTSSSSKSPKQSSPAPTSPVRKPISFSIKPVAASAKVQQDDDSEKSKLLRQVRTYMHALDDQLNQKLKVHNMNPEKHPLYAEEWTLFWNRRYKEVTIAGKDASKHDFKPEWIQYWTKKVCLLMAEERKERLVNFCKELGAPELVQEVLGEAPAEEIVSVNEITTAKSEVQKITEEEAAKDETIAPDDIIGVLRLLAALEMQLGSLGPKIYALLSHAIALEKQFKGSAVSLIDIRENIVLFETLKEKLKGQLCAGMVEKNMLNGTKKAISAITALSQCHDKRSSLQKASKITKAIAAHEAQPLSVPEVKVVDKFAIAQQITLALVAQGKTDLAEGELEQLIDTVVSMAQSNISKVGSSKPADEKRDSLQQLLSSVAESHSLLQESSPTTSTHFAKENNSSLKLLQEYSAHTATHSAEVVNSSLGLPQEYFAPTTSANIDLKSTVPFDEHDLRVLFQNFRTLSHGEQQYLTAHLKKIESKEPELVAKLRKFIECNDGPALKKSPDLSSMLSAFPSVVGESSRTITSNLKSKPILLDDDDDDVWKAAKNNNSGKKKLSERDLVVEMIKDQEKRGVPSVETVDRPAVVTLPHFEVDYSSPHSTNAVHQLDHLSHNYLPEASPQYQAYQPNAWSHVTYPQTQPQVYSQYPQYSQTLPAPPTAPQGYGPPHYDYGYGYGQ